ncbi:hypothetical protein TRFO_13278 [Tritrichomonas foetus]|uniref:Uncharacterized protein n=1 Tax=Tritrichomonas foetus TaxID=1144522 RepID=A0A1J4KYD6_9EUKA|nr:hypothetical protein TRFO_13278 [Tritrichomonas foetus]|eukprot:OHT16273.1 hypothetical protein TRFO_13278 [Tritrichomonas foetus]
MFLFIVFLRYDIKQSRHGSQKRNTDVSELDMELKSLYHSSLRKRINKNLRYKTQQKYQKGIIRQLGFDETKQKLDTLLDLLQIDQEQFLKMYSKNILNRFNSHKYRKSSRNDLGSFWPVINQKYQFGEKPIKLTEEQERDAQRNPLFGFASYPLFPFVQQIMYD